MYQTQIESPSLTIEKAPGLYILELSNYLSFLSYLFYLSYLSCLTFLILLILLIYFCISQKNLPKNIHQPTDGLTSLSFLSFCYRHPLILRPPKPDPPETYSSLLSIIFFYKLTQSIQRSYDLFCVNAI